MFELGIWILNPLLLSQSYLLINFRMCYTIIYHVFLPKKIDFGIDLLVNVQPIFILQTV